MGCFRDRNGKFTLQRRAKVSAIVDMVLGGVGIVASGVDLEKLMGIQEDPTTTQTDKDDALKTMYFICVVLAIHCLRLIIGYTLWNQPEELTMKTVYLLCVVLVINSIKLLMGYTLWNGAKERDYSKCRTWLIVSVILWMLQLASYVVKLGIGAFVLGSTISTGLALLGRIFAMKAVSSYVGELGKERLLSGTGFVVV